MTDQLEALRSRVEALDVQLRRLESGLRDALQRESRLRQILDLVPDFIFASDWDGRYLLVNRALAGAHGTTPEALCGQLKTEASPGPAQGEDLLGADREAMRSATESFTPAMDVIDAQGHRRVVQHRRIPYQEAGSGRPAVLGVATDITRLKQAEEALEAARVKLQDAIDSVGDGFLLFDAEDRLVMKNARMREVVEEGAGAFEIGATFEHSVHRLYHEGHYADARGLPPAEIEARIAQRIELHRHPPSSHEREFSNGRWVLVSTRATSEGGRIVLYTDITERKRSEAELMAKERMQADLNIARHIQESLLPSRSPEVPGYAVWGWNRAADETGGDYFDWVRLPDGRLVVSIADVAGHGIGSALLVAVCRAYFRASGSVPGSLAQVMGRVNTLLAEDLTEGRFITAAVGVLDPQRHRMEFFSAGHGPVLFHEAVSGKIRVYQADGVPLGILAQAPVAAGREIVFAPGDTLVLVTDGFFEWANAGGERFGLERLLEAVRRHAASSPAPRTLIDALYSTVRDFAGDAPQADDLTALVVKRDSSTGLG